MKRSAKLDKIAALNGGLENMAGNHYAAAQARHEQGRHQLEQLMIYREDYQQRLNERVRAPVSAKEMRDYRFFFDSLEQAIRQQEVVVAQLDRERELARSEWLLKRREVKKVAQAADNLRAREQRSEEAHEQKESDERSLLQAAPRRAGLFNELR